MWINEIARNVEQQRKSYFNKYQIFFEKYKFNRWEINEIS